MTSTCQPTPYKKPHVRLGFEARMASRPLHASTALIDVLLLSTSGTITTHFLINARSTPNNAGRYTQFLCTEERQYHFQPAETRAYARRHRRELTQGPGMRTRVLTVLWLLEKGGSKEAKSSWYAILFYRLFGAYSIQTRTMKMTMSLLRKPRSRRLQPMR